VIDQKYKVFAFTFLILSLALLPPTNFAFAQTPPEILVVDGVNVPSPYIVSSDEQWNTVSLEVGTSLIILLGATLTVNQIDFQTPLNGLHIKNNAVVTIETGGILNVSGWTFNLGEIYIDGTYSHLSDTIFTPAGTIYQRCGLLTEESPPTYSIQGNITDDFENCNNASNIITKVNFTVEEGDTFTIEKNEILNLFGETTLHGFLINKGILNNPTIVTLAGGEIRNIEGTINNICGGQGYPFPAYVGSGGDQNVGIVNDVPCLEPEAVDDNYQVNEDEILTVSAPGVLENDTDYNGVGINATNPSTPSDGTLSDFALDGSFTYTPNENFFGIDSFTYEVKDGYSVTDIATVRKQGRPWQTRQARGLARSLRRLC